MLASAIDAFRIRPARSSDVRAILALWQRAGIQSNAARDAAAIRVRLRRDRDLFLVALDGSRVVGSLIAGWDGWRGTMARLAVDPAYRRRGIAERLLRTVEKNLRKRGATRIGALVFISNTLGAKFWQAAGYQRESNVRRFVKDLR